MKIRVEFTAQLKRAAGTDSEEVELGHGCTVLEAVEAILAQHGGEVRAQLLDRDGNIHPSLVVAVNGEQVFPDSSRKLSDGDTVVFLAAIAGG